MRMLSCVPPRPSPSHLRWRRILVVPLLTRDPTSAGEQGEVTDDGVAVERKETTAAEPALGVMTRSRSRRMAALALALPAEILVWEIFVRLPAKDILCCRVVCRTWRDLASAADFVLAHHRRQPSLPLLTLCGSTEGRLPIFERGCPVLGFDDYDALEIHASCDGLLLLSLFHRRFFICNPATRQCVPVPCMDAYDVDIAALYLHCPSGEYRVLYRKGSKGRHGKHRKATYYILTVPGRSPRCIGIPSDTPGSKKFMLTFNTTTSFTPPIVFHNCLHWDPGCRHSDARIIVFDTVVESFGFMRSPAGATRFCTSLCDMEGSMGFSCSDHGRTIVKIWVLEDYAREVWSFKYHVKLPVESLCNLEDTQHLVLSHNGDLLVYSISKDYVFHCDSSGKLLEEFRFDPWSSSISGHWYKENLVKHNLFRTGGACAGQSLFHRL